MTINEAIQHYLEEAGELQKRADSAELIDVLDGLDVEACKECAEEHRQLAEWLTELLQRRDWCAQYEVEQISNLEQYDMLSREYELLNERYEEAKRLLKQIVTEFDEMADRVPRGYCPFNAHYISCSICLFKDYDGADVCGVWQYRAEALKLIGGSENGS